MNTQDALQALSALSHETRLHVFRLLVKAGPEGLQAGQISTELAVRQNTLSSNLSILAQAGLIVSAREGRAVRYFVSMNTMAELLKFLMEDCCGGRLSLSAPLQKELRNAR